jgi:hypothetical protein
MLSMSNSSSAQTVHTRGITPFNQVALAVPRLSLDWLFKEKLVAPLAASNVPLPELKGLNETFTWQAARIYALYEAIYQQGIVTDKDLPKLYEMEMQLNQLSQSLSSAQLSQTQQTHAAKAFNAVQYAISEARGLIKELQHYDKIAVALNATQDSCMNCCYDPNFQGAALQSVGKLKAIFSAFNTLRVHVEKKDMPENAAKRVETLFQGEAEALDWLVENWVENLQDTINQEFNELKEALARAKDAQHKIPLARQFQALLDQLKQTARELKRHRDPRTIIAPLPNLQPLLDKTRENCLIRAKEIQGLLAEQADTFLLEPLHYGSEEWLELAKQRPKRKERAAYQVEPFQSWSQTRKDWVTRLFAAMQLTAGVLDFPSSALQKAAAKQSGGQPDGNATSEIATLTELAPLTSAAPRTTNWASSVIHEVGSYLNPFSTPAAEAYSPAFIQQTASKGFEALKEAHTQLQEMQIESSHIPLASSELEELRQEIALLRRELMRTVSETPDSTCPVLKLAEWFQTAEDKCYAVQALETHIGALMEAARKHLSISDEKLKQYGKKHENNILQKRIAETLRIPGISVPLSLGAPSDAGRAFLTNEVSEIFEEWHALGTLYSSYKGEKPFLKQPQVQKHLEAIQKGIASAFEKASKSPEGFKAFGLPEEMPQWLQQMRQKKSYLMVRSTGAEDSRATANAGGNISKAYVAPEQEPLFRALGEVLQSYFSSASLQNRLNAKINPFEEELKLAVTCQELIGEPIGGAKNPKEIPVSVVMFTNEPLYIGTEKFRLMRISAAYGHGEGVVGNRGIATDTALLLISEAHPDQLYILYDNQEKPVRLAPVSTPQGIELEKLPNPPEWRNRRALDDALLKRLYHWGVVGEKFFDDKPTDMELVIKEGVIHPVQARPVNRKPLLPTYLDMRKIAALPKSPIRTQMKGEMIVPGKASVVFCNEPEEVLFASTLEQAEKMYTEESGVKLVVVSQQEPANSHPVVNFSSLSMPCLFMEDAEQAKKLIESITPDSPLVACVQTATLQTLDIALVNPETLVSEGFAVHPAKIAFSLPMEERLAKGSKPSAVPQEIKDLLLDIRSALTADVAAAKLKQLREHGWIQQLKSRKQELQAQMQQLQIVPKGATKVVRFLEKLENAVEAAFEESISLLPKYSPEKRLQPLFHAKVLEKILLQDASKQAGIGRYTLSDIESILEATRAVIEYQKKLPHVAHFGDILPAMYLGVSQETETSWSQFLLELEPLVENGQIPPQQVRQIKQFIATLDQAGALPAWLVFFLPQVKNLEQALSSLPPGQAPFVQHLLNQKERIQALRGSLEAFGDPKQFASAWEELLQIGVHLTEGLKGSSAYLAQLDQATPLARLIAIKTMQDLVDLFDTSIKAMKIGADQTPLEKTKQLKIMLKPYAALLEKWLLQIPESKTIPVHPSWPLTAYVNRVKEILNSASDAEAAQMRPSRGFSVAAAALGTKTAFERHLPATLEDLFTLIHQNLIVCTSNLANSLLSAEVTQQAALPPDLKAAIQKFTPEAFGRRIQRIGFEVADKQVQVRYNVPLRNHSGQLILAYDQATGKMTLTAQLLGQARTRWPILAQKGAFLSESGILPFSKPLVQGAQEIIFSWKIENDEMLKIALEEYALMAEDSLGDKTASVQLGEMYIRRMPNNIALMETIKSQSLEELKQELLAVDWPRKRQAIVLLAQLIKNGINTSKIFETIKESRNFYFYSFLIVFVDEGVFFPEAFEEAKKAVYDDSQSTRSGGWNLFEALAKKGHYLNEGIEIAIQQAFDPIEIKRIQALLFFTDLGNAGLDISQGIEVAKKIIDNPLEPQGMRSRGWELFGIHLRKEDEFKETVAFLEERIDSEKLSGGEYSISKILSFLESKEEWVEKALALADRILKNPHFRQAYLYELFYQLISREVYIPKVASVATEWIKSSSNEIRMHGLDLWDKLITHPQGLEAAKKAVGNWHYWQYIIPGHEEYFKTLKRLSEMVILQAAKGQQGH